MKTTTLYKSLQRSISAASVIGLISFGQSATAEKAADGNYKIDPAHTSVIFSINHLGTSELVGRFNTLEGNLKLMPKGDSTVKVTIDTASIDTNHKKRDDHLRGPDFFNARQHPEITFVSDKVSYTDNGEPETIEGKLSLHGKKNPVTLAVTAIGAGKDPWGGYRSGYRASTTIKRSDYGMTYMADGIGDEITITLNIEAIKQ
ncbi:MAG: YceI family protein [Gammaproteobacteria bacterium]